MLVKNELINILLENCTTHEEKARLYSLTETEQAVINDRVMGNIYQSALKRKDINFDSIPYSKGDIKKFDGYDNMIATINMLRQLSKKFGIKMNELDIVDNALSNIRAYRKTFTDAFSLGNQFLIIYYNSLVYACVEATSLILSSYVSYVKTINAVEFTLKKGKGVYGNVCIDSLTKFNKSVKSGEFAKFSKNALDNNKQNFMGSTIAITTAIAVAASIVPILRQLIFYYYDTRMNVSEYLEHQSMFLRLNKNMIDSKNMSADKKNNVIRNQEEYARKLDELSDKIKVNSQLTDKKSMNSLKQDNKSYNMKSVTGNDDGFMFI